ncbi:MAG: hypothetical protein HYV97_01210 [Bdellovibrio sp.]|nr:hypothetical protein [Bdellovibrio sp.]
MKARKPRHGIILMVTGVIHSFIVGIPFFWEKWREFAHRFFFNITPHELKFDRPLIQNFRDIPAEAALWFFISGIALLLLGQIVHSIEIATGRVPRYLGWELLVFGLLFSWMIPISGFPVFLVPQSIFMIVRQMKLGNPTWQKQM